MRHRSALAWLALVALLLLGGCTSTALQTVPGRWLPQVHAVVPPAMLQALAAARSCCATLADLPWQDLPTQGRRLPLALDERAPVFDFPSGRTPVAAWRLPATGRPLLLRVDSRAFMPSGIGGLLKLEAPLALRPQAWLLDGAGRVRRTQAATGPTAAGDCGLQRDGVVFRLAVDITEPAEDAAFLVLGTTDALRTQAGDTVCGVVQDAYAPQGRLEVQWVALDLPAVPDPQHPPLAAEWLRPGGLLSALLASPRSGFLALDAQALHFVPAPAGPDRLGLPRERIVAADAVGDELRVDSLGAAEAAAMRHVFRLSRRDAQAAGDTSPAGLAAALQATVERDRLVESTALAVLPGHAELQAATAAGAGAGGRILQGANTAGVVTAMPCGLCQTGACPPEVLGSCAGLYAVGAVVGGLWQVGQELLRPGVAAPAGDLRPALATAGPALRQRLDDAAQQACLATALADAGVWRDQGRSTRPQPAAVAAAAPAAAPVRVLQARLQQMSLVALPASGSATAADVADTGEPGLRLRLELQGELRWTADGSTRRLPLQWHGPPRWVPPDVGSAAAVLAALFDEACAGWAGATLAEAFRAWQAMPPAEQR